MKGELIQTFMTMDIVCIGVSTHHQEHYPPLSCQASLKSENCPSPPFLGNPHSILVFCEHPPYKSDFLVNPQNIKVFHP